MLFIQSYLRQQALIKMGWGLKERKRYQINSSSTTIQKCKTIYQPYLSKISKLFKIFKLFKYKYLEKQ